MKKNDKTIYCIECGTKNEASDEKCTKCHKKLYPKDHALKDYVWGKFTGGVQDEFFKAFIRFLKKHLYGILMSCSVIFTGVAIVANAIAADGHIEKVTERPVIEKIYTGEGLSGLELVTKYVESIKVGDEKVYRGLLLEYALPEVYASIKDETNNEYGGWKTKPIATHTLIDYGKYYFKEGAVHIDYDEVPPYNHGKFKEYEFYRYDVSMNFCSKGNCESLGGFYTTDQVEILKVDGNFYVLGEDHHIEFCNISDMVMRGLLFQANGDTSNIDFNEQFDEMDKKYNFLSEEEVAKIFPEH